MPSECPAHSGIKAKLKFLCDFKEAHERDYPGTIRRLHEKIERRTPLKLFYVLITVLCLLFAGIFGLQVKSLVAQGEIKTEVTVLQDQMKR